MHNNHSGAMKEKSSTQEVVDGSDITELVENERVLGKFVDHKFQELDGDGDGKLSVKELQPAVADIGAALGLPAQGTSTDSDHIYTEVLNEFTDGKHKKISKTKFKEVLSDILLGMAAGLKRDPVVILRIDGEELCTFVGSPTFEPEMISIFSEIDLPYGSLKDYVVKAFEKLSIDHGMPPSTDHWVMCDIVEPALQSLGGIFEQPVSQEAFFAAFQRSVEGVSRILKEKPVIVAHSQNSFDGSGIRSLMSNKFELDKTLDLALKTIPKDRNGKLSKDFLNVALDALASSAGLPPLGALQELSVKELQHAVADIGAALGLPAQGTSTDFDHIYSEVVYAPMYITIGDGGNLEGLATNMTEPQPKYSAFREASFGHATFDIKNRTHACYSWHRNQDGYAVQADSMWFSNRY